VRRHRGARFVTRDVQAGMGEHALSTERAGFAVGDVARVQMR